MNVFVHNNFANNNRSKLAANDVMPGAWPQKNTGTKLANIKALELDCNLLRRVKYSERDEKSLHNSAPNYEMSIAINHDCLITVIVECVLL